MVFWDSLTSESYLYFPDIAVEYFRSNKVNINYKLQKLFDENKNIRYYKS